MENAQTILVIFLSAAFAIFLILAIALVAVCLKIAKTIQRITLKAEEITDKAESIAEFFQRAATPVTIGRVISQVAEKVFNIRSNGHK